MEKYIGRRKFLKVSGVTAVGAFALVTVGCESDSFSKPDPKALPYNYSADTTAYKYRVHVEIDGDTSVECFSDTNPQLGGDKSAVFNGIDLYCPEGNRDRSIQNTGRDRLGMDSGRVYWSSFNFAGYKVTVQPQEHKQQ